MRKHLALGLLLSAVATSVFAAGPRFTTAAHPAIGLVEPARGATLRGGGFASVSWTALRPFEAEEWEAFLSIDGGRYYAVRLTPHLDIAVRTFTFLVPNIDSDNVRILIRTGDERNETIADFPQRFSIRASRAMEFPARSLSRGPEAARPGDDVVVQWNGRFGRAESSTPAESAITCAPDASEETIDGTLPTQAAAAIAFPSEGPSLQVRQRTIEAPPSLPSRDLLRLTHRLNI